MSLSHEHCLSDPIYFLPVPALCEKLLAWSLLDQSLLVCFSCNILVFLKTWDNKGRWLILYR